MLPHLSLIFSPNYKILLLNCFDLSMCFFRLPSILCSSRYLSSSLISVSLSLCMSLTHHNTQRRYYEHYLSLALFPLLWCHPSFEKVERNWNLCFCLDFDECMNWLDLGIWGCSEMDLSNFWIRMIERTIKKFLGSLYEKKSVFMIFCRQTMKVFLCLVLNLFDCSLSTRTVSARLYREDSQHYRWWYREPSPVDGTTQLIP